MDDAVAHAEFHRGERDLLDGLDEVRRGPVDVGTVELLVTRPGVDERVTHGSVMVDVDSGVVGDSWLPRGNSRTPDGAADPDAQVTVMNVRAARLVAGTDDRVPLAGDQVYLDLDISTDNLPSGSRLDVGEAVLEVTTKPHTGCAKFAARFGVAALRLTATPEGKRLRLRGLNARVLRGGTVHVGDVVRVTRPTR